ncbi:MAG TPA: DUF397 domain-containing protein [Micromonosporaceae bacterium]|nr:DUF397 domain-containing protein [Micromonosporaceae bacterium]
MINPPAAVARPQLDGRWRTSTRTLENGACVEVRLLNARVEIRDSKDRTGPVLRFSPDQWTNLISAIIDGRL